MSEVKAELNNIESQKLGSHIDLLEVQTREQYRVIKSLENRRNAM